MFPSDIVAGRENRSRGRRQQKEMEREREKDPGVECRAKREGKSERRSGEKERDEPFTKRFFAPYFLTRTSNRKHTSDILRRLVDVERTSSDLLIPTTILTAFVRWSLPGGDDWGRPWQGCERLCTPPTCIVFSLSVSLSLFLYIWLHLCLSLSLRVRLFVREIKEGEKKRKEGRHRRREKERVRDARQTRG